MELLTINGMAQLLGVSPKSLYRWVQQRRIPFIKLEHHLRFQPEVVIDHFKRRTEESTTPCFQSDILLQNLSSGRRGHRSLKIGEKAAGSYSEKG